MINEALNGVDFSTSRDNIAIFVELITNGTIDGSRSRWDIAIYAAKLCDFDFDPETMPDEQEAMSSVLKKMISCINNGNEYRPVGTARWQYGYDDFAENVAWVCCRLTLEGRAAECVNSCEC